MIALSYSRLSSEDARKFRRENPSASGADVHDWVSRSIANQLQHNREQLLAAGDVLDSEWTDDGVSGQSIHRRGMDGLLARARELRTSGAAVRVWMKNTKRLSRDVDLTGWYTIELRRLGVEVVLWAERDETKLLRRIHAVIAESHADDSREDAMRELDKRAAAGLYNGGPIPFGMIRVGDHLQPDPETALQVARAFAMILDGETIADTARALGWRRPALRYRLRSPVYAGAALWNRHRHVPGPNGYYAKLRPTTEWKIVWGAHPAVVPRATWEAVQARLDKFSTDGRRAHSGRRILALTGLLRCGGCELPMRTVGGYDRRGERVWVYGCRTEGCRAIRAVETGGWTKEILEYSADTLTRREIAEAALELLVETWQAGRSTGRLEETADRLEQSRNRLVDAIADPDAGDVRLLSAKLREIDGQLSSAREALRGSRSEAPRPTLAGVETWLADLSRAMRTRAAGVSVDLAAGDALRGVVESVTLAVDRSSARIPLLPGIQRPNDSTRRLVSSLYVDWVPPGRGRRASPQRHVAIGLAVPSL